MSETTEFTKSERPDFLDIIIKRKLKLDDQWKITSWQRVDPDGFLVAIGKYRKIMRGKRKGQDTWTDTKGSPLSERKQSFITLSEIEQEEKNWEKATGKCSQCGGDGQQLVGFSVVDGSIYDTCRKCNGSGDPNSIKYGN